ncbi:MAG: hypothetical protein ACPGSN_02830 [Psychrobium sp.]
MAPYPILTLAATLLLISNLAYANEDEWEEWEDDTVSPFTYSGFVQAKYGRFITSQPSINTSAKDLTLRLEAQYDANVFQAQFKADSQYQLLTSDWHHQIRELAVNVDFTNINNAAVVNSPLGNLSLKIGRQSLSWGLGEYVFLNDLFAKDWQSFFNGNDISYLKKPNDAIKLSYFFEQSSLDVVYQHKHNVDELYQPLMQNAEPHRSSINARYYFSRQQTDYAFYASDGFANTPQLINGKPEYAALQSVGASLVKPLAGGLIKAEFSQYWLNDSLDHSSKQQRYLLGFEREIVPRLNLSLQAYLERDSENFTLNNRQLITSGLTYNSADNNWTSQITLFHSLNHHDSYARLSTSYRYSDNLIISGNLNNLTGQNDTFFGQLATIDNAALRLTVYF